MDRVFEWPTFMVRSIGPEMNRLKPLRMTGGGAIMLCKRGTACLTVDTRKHAVSARTGAVVMGGCMVSLNDCSPDFLCTLFYFPEDMFRRATAKMESLLFHHLAHMPVWNYPEDVAACMEHYFSLLKWQEADTENRYRDVIATNLLRSILLDIYDKIKRKPRLDGHRAGYTRAEELFSKFIDLLLANLTERRDVQFYADQLCITTRYLTAVTAAIANKNPKQIIDEHVVQEIKILLTFSEMTLQQIADYLHFPDSSYLGRFFKRHTGSQLAGYRAQAVEM